MLLPVLRGVAALLAGAVVVFSAAPGQAAEKYLTATVDHAEITKLPANTATVVVGNPLIADATVQKNGILVVTGRSYGSTNLVALDAGGNILTTLEINVLPVERQMVTLYRGASRTTYNCTPVCETAVKVGDEKEYFDNGAHQIGVRNALSSGQSGAQQ